MRNYSTPFDVDGCVLIKDQLKTSGVNFQKTYVAGKQ